MKNESSSNRNSDRKYTDAHKRGRGASRGRRPDQRRDLANLSPEELQRYFVVCSCCGLFLASYRVLHGAAAVEEAGRQAQDGWVALTWDQPTRHLLRDIYDIRSDVNTFHLESMCRECQRRIVFAPENQTDSPGATLNEDETNSSEQATPPDTALEQAATPQFRMSIM